MYAIRSYYDQKPLAAAILLILKNENIEPNKYILEAQNVFGESYTIQLLKVALQKNAKNPTGYIRKNLNHGKKWESIEALIENNIVIDKKEQAIKEGLEHDRITSYNVCYTKLLRNPPISYKEQKKGLKKKVVAQIGGQPQDQKPLAAAILLILKNENIEPNKYILEAQNVS